MALYDHDWDEVNMNGTDWSVKFGLYDTGGGADWLNTVQMADSTSFRNPSIPDTMDRSFKEVQASEKQYAQTRRLKRPRDTVEAPRGQAELRAVRFNNPYAPTQF
jgi:hypothetical protein